MRLKLLLLPALFLAAPAAAATLDDASGLNRTEVAEILKPKSEDDIRRALLRAAAAGRKVSIAGARHSMGGHTLGPGRVVLDMTGFNAVAYDPATQLATVQSGATWSKVLRALDPLGRSVRIMQSDNIFTIGGALSVNVHGWQAKSPPVVSSVESFRLMLSSGQVVTCSRSENAELFRGAVGGYGLLGVIVDVRLRTTANVLHRRLSEYFPAEELPERFVRQVDGDSGVELAFGRLSIAHDDFLREASIQVFPAAPQPARLPKMKSEPLPWLARAVFQAEERGDRAKRNRWELERRYMVAQNGRTVTRNTLLNNTVKAYWPPARGRRDILHEYFVPVGRYRDFLEGLRRIVPAHRANLLNVTVRDVRRDEDSLMAYARTDVFAFVMFFSQSPDGPGDEDMRVLTGKLVDLAGSVDGTFYLPYRPHYSREQLRKAYPRLDQFLELKRRIDPTELFSSSFYDRIR